MSYADLQTEIADYMHRDDLAAFIPGFIRKATARLGRDLKSQFNQTVNESFMPLTEVSALPTDYRGMVDLSYAIGTSRISLVSRNQEGLRRFKSFGAPCAYDVLGINIEIRPFREEEFRLIYFNEPAALDNFDDTNPVLDVYPYLYLYATLIEATIFTQDQEATQNALTIYTSEIDQVNTQSAGADAGARPSMQSGRR